MLFRQGHLYIGGADVPFFVSDNALRSGATDKGFTGVQVKDRDDVPLSTVPPQARGDWNTMVSGRWAKADADISLPSQVAWVVDVTPAPVVMTTAGSSGGALPPPAPFPFPIPLPPDRPTAPSDGTKLNVPSGLGMPLVVGMGVIGGVFLGAQGAKHMFVEGLTADERKNILMYGASALAIWGIAQLFKLEDAWWASPEGMFEKAKQQLP